MLIHPKLLKILRCKRARIVVTTIYKRGMNKQSQEQRDKEIIQENLIVQKDVRYFVKAEVLRNDLGDFWEYVNSITLDGRKLFEDKCSPDGDDYDCTFAECPVKERFSITSSTGTIAVKMDFKGHSRDCDCDLQTWTCAKENTNNAFVPVEAVARFTLTTDNGILLD